VQKQLHNTEGNAGEVSQLGDADSHLAHLLPPPEIPLYRSLYQGIRELINPPKLPPLEITSKPIEVPTMKGLYSNKQWNAGLVSAKRGSTAGVPQLDEADSHLVHLLPPPEIPFYRSLYQGIEDLIRPPKLPPLEITSKPIEVPTMKGLYAGNEWKAGLLSTTLNVGIVLLLLVVGTNQQVQKAIKEQIILIAPNLNRPLPPRDQIAKGGGGSPQKMPETQGKLPKVAPKQFVPPTVHPIENRKLTMPVTIIADMELPNINTANFGDPLAGLGIPSIGNGIDAGIGPGRGPGLGPGSSGGFGGGAYRPGGVVSMPVAVYSPEPEYSEEARKAKYQGYVILQIVVGEDGGVKDIRVVRPVGLGLDAKAIEAVAKWRFKPGIKDGKPVAVIATVEVTFRLL